VYQFPSLLASDYVLRVESPAFTPAERAMALLVGQSLPLDFQLRTAQASAVWK